jgi:hypothetical protein
LIPIVGVGAAFVGWRFYLARNASDDDESSIVDGEFGAVDASIPGVIGALNPNNEYGSGPVAEPPSNDSYGFHGTTNAQWSQYVISQLQQGSDSWSYSTITTAIGNYLGSRPLSDAQQAIVRSAIAVGGYPPVGSHTIVPGGNTALTVAPGGLKVTTTATTAVLTFNSVAGAASYRAFRGVASSVGSAAQSPITVSGLKPNTSYTFSVRGVTASGKDGPESTKVTARTKAVIMPTPAKPRATSITKTSAYVSTGKVSGADGYNWYLNGMPRGHSDAPSYTMSGLKTKTNYRVSVAADTSTGAPGKQSPTVSFKTK